VKLTVQVQDLKENSIFEFSWVHTQIFFTVCTSKTGLICTCMLSAPRWCWCKWLVIIRAHSILHWTMFRGSQNVYQLKETYISPTLSVCLTLFFFHKPYYRCAFNQSPDIRWTVAPWVKNCTWLIFFTENIYTPNTYCTHPAYTLLEYLSLYTLVHTVLFANTDL